MSTTASQLNSFPSYTTSGSAVTPEEAAASSQKMPQNAASVTTRKGSDELNGGASGTAGTAGGASTATTAAAGAGGGSVLIGSKPTLISVSPMRFLIMDAPRQSNLHLYIRECRRHGVTDVVRVCEPTYLAGELEAAGIGLHEMAYPDGTSPPREVLDQWLALVEDRFYKRNGGGGGAAIVNGAGSSGVQPTIAVHCVAGLGRAPVLVAIALVEFANMDPVEAVTLIRKHRRGAINEKQLNYLEQYKRSYRRADSGGCCVLL
jgi:protein tyrosine phosphatase type 4A